MSLPDKSFALEWIFPDVHAILDQDKGLIDSSKDDALVFLDANVLLAPYKLDSSSLGEIKKVYKSLRNQDRLYVPVQAMREFIKNRPSKIAELVQTVRDHSSMGVAPKNKVIEALRGNMAYEAMITQAEEIESALKKFRRNVDDVINHIEGWAHGNDPVLDAYRETLHTAFCDLSFNDEERQNFIKEQKFRQDLKIPPGYKDASKPDDGSGDLLIWKTILKKVSIEHRNAIFVTLEEKGDWFVKGGGILQVRPELQEEFRRASNGKRFYILSMSIFLKTFEASPDVVAATDSRAMQSDSAISQREEDVMETTLRNRLSEIEIEYNWLENSVQESSVDGDSREGTYWHVGAPTLKKRLGSLKEQANILKRRLGELRGES